MHAVESRRFVRFSTVDGEFIARISCATHKNSGVHFVPSPSGGTSPCRVGSAATSSWVVDAMRLSRGFIPTLKQTPNEAQIVSHRLMLRAGLIRQTSAGIYAWLPLGLRALKNIERIVREEQDGAGAQEVLMPTIQSADLWRESGRYDAYGPEMLRIRDRQEREMLFGPTNEEMITVLFRDGAKSY